MTYEAEDPSSGQRVVFHETRGDVFEVELFVAPGGFVREHLHPTQEETFVGVEGTLALDVDGRRRTVGPGETVVIPPRTRHGFRDAPEAAHLRVTVTPALRLDAYFRAYLGLSRDGRLRMPVEGLPRPLLQAAVLLDDFSAEIAAPGIPLFLQRGGLWLLAQLGALKGYRRVLPEYGVF